MSACTTRKRRWYREWATALRPRANVLSSWHLGSSSDDVGERCATLMAPPVDRILAEGVGFEPTREREPPGGFQDRCLKPLGHPSWAGGRLANAIPGRKADRGDLGR